MGGKRTGFVVWPHGALGWTEGLRGQVWRPQMFQEGGVGGVGGVSEFVCVRLCVPVRVLSDKTST